MKKLLCALFVFSGLIWPAFADNALFVVSPKKVLNPPLIDGGIEDPAWDDAPLISDFIQFEPQKGNPATVRTEVRIVYDDTHIYFGF